jgi:hypothetical protein
MSRPTTLEIQQAQQEGYDQFVRLYGAFKRSQLPYTAATPNKTPTVYDSQPVLRNNFYQGWKAAYDEKVESTREVWECTKNRIRHELKRLGY